MKLQPKKKDPPLIYVRECDGQFALFSPSQGFFVQAKTLAQAHTQLKLLEQEHLDNLKKFGFADDDELTQDQENQKKRIRHLRRLRKLAQIAFFLGLIAFTINFFSHPIKKAFHQATNSIHKRLTLSYLLERELVMMGRWSQQDSVDKAVALRKALENLDPLYREYLKGFSPHPLTFDPKSPLPYGEKPTQNNPTK